jgi:ABC-type nitrate/sulfonate/bicarbonate transport system permease component
VNPALPARRWRARPRWVDRVAGIALVVVAWHLLAVTVLAASRGVPTPGDVLRQLWHDRDSYPPNVKTTLHEALVGYFWGNLIALALGLLFELVPIVEGPLLRLAIASFNIPLVAIAPILVVTLSGDGPKAALAALAVFFTTLIATVLGLRSADVTSLDLIRAYGGGTGTALRKVKLWAALPSVFAGLRIAAPAALLGAVIGEFLGANQGLGVAMINAQSSFAVARTWGIALVISALAGVLYLIASVLARLLTPWAGQTDLGLATLLPLAASGSVWVRVARAAALFVVSIAVMIGAWYALIRGFDLNPFFAKDPEAVYRFLFTANHAADHRRTLLDALGRTLQDAAAGYVVGMLAATAAAVVVVLSPGVEQAVMPVAIALRSVPLVALTPLIALLFGRGFWGVTIVVGLVTFFPTLVNVGVGLRSAPALACDVVRAAGGESMMAIRKVRLPYAIPALFASARIAAPAAIGGATLAEWLATGKGLGSLLVISYSASDFNTLWSGAVLIVTVSVGLYSLVGVIEALVIARMRG